MTCQSKTLKTLGLSFTAVLLGVAMPAHAKKDKVAAPAATAMSAGTGAGNIGLTTAHAPNPSQRICSIERFTGSYITRKICKTRAEWTAQGADLTGI